MSATDLYLNLMARVLTRYGFPSAGALVEPPEDSFARYLTELLEEDLGHPVELSRPLEVDLREREVGRDWPLHAETMVGLHRLRNVRCCIESALEDDVSGDLVETGVWRGGVAIFMRAILAAYGVEDRCVWAADSFQGLPPPDLTRHPRENPEDPHSTFEPLAVSREEVEAAFRRYDLLDDQVRFLEGWFHETLPEAPIEKIAVLRLDGDMYSSTMDALTALYDRVSSGGFVIIDDYGAIESCRRAVEDFRQERGVTAKIQKIDWTGAYWRVPE